MSRTRKILDRVLRGTADSNIRFTDLRSVLLALGFSMRIRGSHHVFRHPLVVERVNLQVDGAHAKPYQVRQVRRILLKYGIASLGEVRDD